MPKQAGFSLLEVLVAFSIFAISLGVLYQVFGTSLRASAMGGHYSHAIIIAESKLALAMEQTPLKAMSDSGDEDGYHWQLEVARYDDGEELKSALFAPYALQVVVSWNEGASERAYELNSLRLGEP